MAAVTQKRIDFANDPVVGGSSTGKPANLANSAVLRMLQEEEEQRRQGNNPERQSRSRTRQATTTTTTWRQEHAVEVDRETVMKISRNCRPRKMFHWPPSCGYRTVAWPPPHEAHLRQPSQEKQHLYTPQVQEQPPAYSPQSPAPQYQQQQQQHYQAPSPARGGYGQPMNSAQGQQQQTQQPYNYRQPSPASGMVTLRQSTPISQKPVPVYQSQPPVSSFNATRDGNWRGDMKWPPEECKKQAAIENEERLKLAAGPACRPRRGNKDYSEFFARHALNTVYPGYRIPPGTQHIGYD